MDQCEMLTKKKMDKAKMGEEHLLYVAFVEGDWKFTLVEEREIDQ